MNSKNLIIIVLAAVLLIGGYAYYQDQQSEKVSVNIGGKSFSIEAQ